MKQYIDNKEFYRPLRCNGIGISPVVRKIMARPDECQAIAKRLGLLEVRRLNADLSCRMLKSGLFHLTGLFEADIVQSCIVSLEPVPAHLTGEVDMRLTEQEQILDQSIDNKRNKKDKEWDDFSESVMSTWDLEEPEPIVGDEIDLGEIAVEHLAIAMDPYPRLPGARIPARWDGGAIDTAPLAEIAPADGAGQETGQPERSGLLTVLKPRVK